MNYLYENPKVRTEAKALHKQTAKLKRRIFVYEQRSNFMMFVIDIGNFICSKTKTPFEFRKLGRRCWKILEKHIDEGNHFIDECQEYIDKLKHLQKKSI